MTNGELTPPPLSRHGDLVQSGFAWERKSASVWLKFNCGKETTMKLKDVTTIIAPAVVLVAGVVALALSLSVRVPSVAASNARNGQLHVTKLCNGTTGTYPGSYCTIESSNLAEIQVPSTVYYDQVGNVPVGMLDSNVVLSVGTGNWAVGRCTLDRTTHLGLCTFSDGTGPLTGFSARVDVSLDPATGLFHWDGTYSFSPLPPR